MARRDRDERPPIELWGAGPAPAPELAHVAATGPSRSWLPFLAAGALVLLAGWWLVAGTGGGDDPGEAGDRRGEDTPGERAEAATPATQDTAPPTTGPLPAGPVFGQPVGASLLLAGDGLGEPWVAVDLDTGERRELAAGQLPAEAYSAVAVRGGVVVRAGMRVEYRPLQGKPVVLDPVADEVLPSGSLDAVWVGQIANSGWSELSLLDLNGQVLAGPRLVPFGVGLATTEGPIFERGGRVYLHGVDGSRAVTIGTIAGGAGPHLLVVVCDVQARCGYEAVDTATGERRSFGSADETLALGQAVLSPDGAQLAIVTPTSQGVHLQVRRAGGALAWELRGAFVDGPLTWLPGALGLVAPSHSVDGVVRYHLAADGTPTSEELDGLTRRSVQRVLVIPH